ncbi:MAG: nucleoside deaminase [Candidatus Gastranaerophilales bacterium]|nr:nucleoside deaminase [Candidatus Gastranaerophilales bacterium]
MNILSNENIDLAKVEMARKIITDLQNELPKYIEAGSGPFLAVIYDKKGNLIAKCANSVVETNCSNNHAEMNTIRKAQEVLNTFDLSSYELSLYVTSEPCLMCLGGIMWSGIKEIYFGVPSKRVEEITGFDEGFKPNWFEEFKNRGIIAYGNIEVELGEKQLQYYIEAGKNVYKPIR